MEEKFDLKSKYEKLRKKYLLLKQQVTVLKESINKKEDEYKSLDESYKQLEIKYRECSTNLDNSQYKETMLTREIEEVLCQLNQYKQQNLPKQDNQSNTTKSGTGILTGLLPVNNVIMNFQKNEKLEDKILILQEELDMKILENEQLHMNEFDLKKQYQELIEEKNFEINNLNDELKKTKDELEEYKCKAINNANLINEFEQKENKNHETILELKNQLSLSDKTFKKKYTELQELIPAVSMQNFVEKYKNWTYACKQNYYFNFLKFSSSNCQLLKKISSILNVWKSFITNRSSKVSISDNFIQLIYDKILFFLNQSLEKLENNPKILNNNILFKESILEEIYQVNENNRNVICESILYEKVVDKDSKDCFKFIYRALKLQIIIFKIEFRRNSTKTYLMDFLQDVNKKINNFSTIISNIRNLIIKTSNLISFNLFIGKEPDILNIHETKNNSFFYLFLLLSEYIEEYFKKNEITIENKKRFYNYICKMAMEDVFFENSNLNLSEDINKVFTQIIAMENRRKLLYNQINERIKKYVFELSTFINTLNENISFLINCGDHNSLSKSELSNSLYNSIKELAEYLIDNLNHMSKLMPHLYQHPSIISKRELSMNEYEIVMRETQNKLMNAPPKINFSEICNLNKRIEELEESKNNQLDIINNLKKQLKLNSEALNLENIQVSRLNINDNSDNINISKSEPNVIANKDNSKTTLGSENYIQVVCESLLRDANETLEHTVTRLQLQIEDLNDDIKITKQSYDEQIVLLTQHICDLSEKLAQTDASTTSSYNQEILCHSCNNWCTLDLVMNNSKGACQKCKTKLLRLK